MYDRPIVLRHTRNSFYEGPRCRGSENSALLKPRLRSRLKMREGVVKIGQRSGKSRRALRTRHLFRAPPTSFVGKSSWSSSRGFGTLVAVPLVQFSIRSSSHKPNCTVIWQPLDSNLREINNNSNDSHLLHRCIFGLSNFSLLCAEVLT